MSQWECLVFFCSIFYEKEGFYCQPKELPNQEFGGVAVALGQKVRKHQLFVTLNVSVCLSVCLSVNTRIDHIIDDNIPFSSVTFVSEMTCRLFPVTELIVFTIGCFLLSTTVGSERLTKIHRKIHRLINLSLKCTLKISIKYLQLLLKHYITCKRFFMMHLVCIETMKCCSSENCCCNSLVMCLPLHSGCQIGCERTRRISGEWQVSNLRQVPYCYRFRNCLC